MSQQLINRSSDLKRLRDEGYDLEIRGNHLLLKNIPYVNSKREIKRGILVSTLTLAGDITVKPDTHVAFFSGEYPCDKDGVELTRIKHQSVTTNLGKGLVVNHSFSSKPRGGYRDYYEKMATYATLIASPAHAIDCSYTATANALHEEDPQHSAFKYVDSASSRAGISGVASKLELDRVAIIGLGGTGSYVLDLVAKTPVREIHLFDGDVFLSHNAFRAPGAASIEELRAQQKKVNYLKALYEKMRNNIFEHDVYVDASNVNQLQGMDFVFLCIDSGSAKKLIIESLERYEIPFIDVGMGIQLVNNALLGILRVTCSTPQKRDHVAGKNRISFTESNVANDYETNIQVADLNALNATLAVIKWKKLYGFYVDLEQEHHTTYTIDGNHIVNEDAV